MCSLLASLTFFLFFTPGGRPPFLFGVGDWDGCVGVAGDLDGCVLGVAGDGDGCVVGVAGGDGAGGVMLGGRNMGDVSGGRGGVLPWGFGGEVDTAAGLAGFDLKNIIILRSKSWMV